MLDRAILSTALILGCAEAQAASVPHAAPVADIAAQDQIVRVRDNRVTETNDLPTYELRRLRRRMLNDQWISFQDMRRLADAGDGLAAFNYAERLLVMDDPELHSAAALYLATAAYAGRDYAVWKLTKLLDRRDVPFSDKRLKHLENAMRSLALQGSEHAEAALIRYYATGHPFGRHPEKARALMGDMADEGDADAAMKLATQALSGEAPEIGEARLATLLEIAGTSDDLGTRAAARTLGEQLHDGADTAKADTQ